MCREGATEQNSGPNRAAARAATPPATGQPGHAASAATSQPASQATEPSGPAWAVWPTVRSARPALSPCPTSSGPGRVPAGSRARARCGAERGDARLGALGAQLSAARRPSPTHPHAQPSHSPRRESPGRTPPPAAAMAVLVSVRLVRCQVVTSPRGQCCFSVTESGSSLPAQ